ncbi:MAG: hypothetical protein HYR94_01265 [Chloroflexi bacterium]|nr:hypothetical protein [Chloroflexota bacterium]
MPQDLEPGNDESRKLSQYDQVILEVFIRHYQKDIDRLVFKKDELVEICHKYGITVRNIPDIIHPMEIEYFFYILQC